MFYSDEVWQLSEKCVDVETPEHDGIHQADKSATSMTSSQAGEALQVGDIGEALHYVPDAFAVEDGIDLLTCIQS